MPVKVNHRVIRLAPLNKDFNVMLAQIRDNWMVGDAKLGTPPLQELVAGSEKRVALKAAQVFGASDSSRLSKYKKLAEEAAYLGGWEQFFDCMTAEKKRWDDAAAAVPRAAHAEKPRSFRWAEIVQHVNARARDRKKT